MFVQHSYSDLRRRRLLSNSCHFGLSEISFTRTVAYHSTIYEEVWNKVYNAYLYSNGQKTMHH